MKGKYAFDVRELSALQSMIIDKAEELGCKADETMEQGEGEAKSVFVNLEKKVYGVQHGLSLEDYERRYGLAGFEQVSVQEFLRLEKPRTMVALSLFVTEESDWEEALSEFAGKTGHEARVANVQDISQYKGQISRDMVMRAAEQACTALGV